jgi:hypothetical protein
VPARRMATNSGAKAVSICRALSIDIDSHIGESARAVNRVISRVFRVRIFPDALDTGRYTAANKTSAASKRGVLRMGNCQLSAGAKAPRHETTVSWHHPRRPARLADSARKIAAARAFPRGALGAFDSSHITWSWLAFRWVRIVLADCSRCMRPHFGVQNFFAQPSRTPSGNGVWQWRQRRASIGLRRRCTAT